MNPTPLDAALQAAQADPNKRAAFYNLFINSQLFVAVQARPDLVPGLRTARPNERVSILIIKQDGQDIVPVFDSLERLEAWVQQPASYLQMAAHALVQSFDRPVHFGLNPGTDFYKMFVPEEIAWMRDIVRAQQPKAHTVREGTQVMIGHPAQLPPQLLDRLKDVLSRRPEVTAAHLAHAVFGDEAGKPHLLLVVRADAASDVVFQSILGDIGVAIQGVLPDDRPLDILKYSGQGLDESVVKTVKPFYVK